MSIGLFLPLHYLIWGKHVIICAFRVQKSRKRSKKLQLTHFVGPHTPHIDVGHLDFFLEKVVKGLCFASNVVIWRKITFKTHFRDEMCKKRQISYYPHTFI